MIIRALRADENGKANEVRSLGYVFSINIEEESKRPLPVEMIGAFLDDDTTLIAMVHILEYMTVRYGRYVPTLGIGGVATRPEYRRMHAIRMIMEKIFEMAPERGWQISLLYPFSYDYYRKFGYEYIADKMTVKLPMKALGRFERSSSVRLYSYNSKEVLQDILSVYHAYAERFDGMLLHDEKCESYSADPFVERKHTYVHYSAQGVPNASATVSIGENETLELTELYFADPEGLRGILGFLRTYDGQATYCRFHKLPPDSELLLVLGEHVGVERVSEEGAMGRIMLMEAFLQSTVYPTESGHFKLRCEDTLEFNRGVYDVQYANRRATVKKLPYDAAYDISAQPAALSRMLLSGGFTKESAAYLDGVSIATDAADFFKTFTSRRFYVSDFF